MRYATPSLPRERRRKINCEQRFRLHWSMVPVARMSGARTAPAKRNAAGDPAGLLPGD
jgi:hypothetical protein